MFTSAARRLHATLLACLLLTLLAACGGSAATPSPTSAPQPTQPAIPDAAAQPTQPATSGEVPQPTPEGAPAAGEIIHIAQNAVYAQPLDGGEERLLVPMEGILHDAIVDGDALLLLREHGLERLDLTTGEIQTLQTFETTSRGGSRFVRSRDRIFFAVNTPPADLNALFAHTMIGVYTPADGSVAWVQRFERTIEPLGLSATDDSLYILPRGGDPGFGIIQELDLATGNLYGEIRTPGEGAAVVSPDGRYVAVTNRRFDASGNNAESLVQLYDLTQNQPAPVEIGLPEQPSAANNLFWAPDSSGLYYVLGRGDLYTLTAPLGLWRYDVASGTSAKVADIDVINTRLEKLSPDGRFIIQLGQSVQLIDLTSGEVRPLPISPLAWVIGWLPHP